MKGYGKLYAQTVGVSVLVSIFPFILEWISVIAKARVLDRYALPAALVGLVIAIIWVCMRVKDMKHRMMMIFMNPVLYYAIGLTCISIAFVLEEPWNGFHIGG